MAPSHWWLGVNNSRGSRGGGHVHYPDIVAFLRGESATFCWPCSGAPTTKALYPEIRVNDQVVFWMGDGPHKNWGIIGFANVAEVAQGDRPSSASLILSLLPGVTRGITPYPAGRPMETLETAYLRQIFGPTFRPLRKMYLRLGDRDVKPYVITVERLTPSQFRSLRDKATSPSAPAELGSSRSGEAEAGDTTRADGAIAGVPHGEIDYVFRWSTVLTAQDYVAGFRVIERRLSAFQRQLLTQLYNAPRRAAYATQLAKWTNVSAHSVVNARYGAIGHLFSDATGHLPDVRTDGSRRWWSILSLGHHTKSGFIWQMLPEVALALEELGWVAPPVQGLPEEVNDADTLVEGATARVFVNAYERSSEARRRCLAHHGRSCCICGFDFGAKYGPAASGFIHVHHIVPLSTIRGRYEVDPLRDLRPVCANCHAVIHLGGGCRTIDEMKALLSS